MPEPTSNSRNNLIAIALTGLVSAAVGGGAGYMIGHDAGYTVGHAVGYTDGFTVGTASAMTDDEERPPIIVSSGGSVTFELLPHTNGSGRGKIEYSGQNYKHTNPTVANQKPPKGLDVTVYGSGNGDCKGMAEKFKKVTSLVITYGPDANPKNWLDVKFGDPNSATPVDLNWTISLDEKTATVNSLGYILELQHDVKPAWYLRGVALTENVSGSPKPKACLFTQQTANEAILIEQKKN